MNQQHLYKALVFISLMFIGIAQASTTRTIQIYVTVDWEGGSLEQENIATMQSFRKKFPNIPMLQLLNPAYFLRDNISMEQTYKTITSTFLATDTHGMHIHAWKALTQACHVPYQHSYSFADQDENCNTLECGYTVSLEYAYSQEDLTKLVACSRDLLVSYGFNRPRHFRAGGWQLGPKLTHALQANGFIWDSSRTDANLLMSRWHADSGMIKMVRALHPTSTPIDQPYVLADNLMEYPNNASLADYTSSKQIIALFKQLITSKNTVMVLGFHQETATDFLPRLEQAIPQIVAIANSENIQIEWLSH
jgi:hypothetical protein